MNTDRIYVVQPQYPRFVGFRALRVFVKARRNSQRLLAVAVALGILFMLIHWS
jgi:hypothetical protein